MTFDMRLALGATLVATALAGCGGGGGGDSSDDGNVVPPPDPVPTSKFTQSASWAVALPSAGGSSCYDFDTRTEVADCSGSNWDLKVQSGGRSASLWTNSGVSGPGRGGAFGDPFDRSWTELSNWQDATVDPVDGPMPAAVYFPDAANGVFTGTNPIGVAAFEYDLNGQHQFHPNYRVFLITTDNSNADAVGTPAAPVYALQVIGYYGGPTGTQSGFPTIRWVDRSAPAVVRTATVDASSNTAWVYFDLTTGTVVSTGTEAPASGNWHIAFNRYNVKLNGGDSSPGNVAGYIGKTPAGLYDAAGAPITSAFLAATPAGTLADLTATDIEAPARAQDWIGDASSSTLQADYRGNFPEPLDFGWYVYYPTAQAAQAAGLPPTAHLLAAKPEGAALLRSGEGNSYARFHISKIEYADPSNSGSAQTWTIDFDVQPAQ